MPQTALLLSIRPRFADMIFEGIKLIELRRLRPRVQANDLVFVYVSSPVKALVGAFVVERVVEGKPATIWRKWGKKTGLSRDEFDGYFDGVENGFGMVVSSVWRLPAPVQLAALRKRKTGFRPPQAYHYLPLSQLNRLGGITANSAANN